MYDWSGPLRKGEKKGGRGSGEVWEKQRKWEDRAGAYPRVEKNERPKVHLKQGELANQLPEVGTDLLTHLTGRG